MMFLLILQFTTDTFSRNTFRDSVQMRIQSWEELANRGNLVKPVPTSFFARFRHVLGVKVLGKWDRLDAAWGRVLGLAANTIKNKTTCEK